jgi:[ribosomal protein S5]-alanine N-acetyltransferase
MEIQTDRLIVRQFRPDDWRDLHDYLSLPEIYAFEPGEPVDAEQAAALADGRS